MRLQINQKQQITEGVTVAAIFVFVFGGGIFYYGQSLILPPQVITVAGLPP